MAFVKLYPPETFNEVHLELPASKSISNRLLVLSAIFKQNIPIHNLSQADDTQLMLSLINQINAHKPGSQSCELYVQNAGTVIRFLTAFLSNKKGAWVLQGSKQMMQRPIGILVDALRNLGADIHYLKKEGFPPVFIKGKKLHGGELRIESSVSSQFVSALLMIAPSLSGGLSIQWTSRPVSRPYIDMTLKLMNDFGIRSKLTEDSIHIARQKLQSHPMRIEADWSSAAFWYTLAALSGYSGIFLKGLKKTSIQGDVRLTDIFKNLGVESRFDENGVQLISTQPTIDGFAFDFTDCPDLAQAVAVCCAGLNIPARLSGLKNLRIKETDRLTALESELRKLGFSCHSDENDTLIIDKKTKSPKPSSTLINSYGDHRMAMAFAALSIVHPGLGIDNPAVVSKSYPGFWKAMERLGFNIFPEDDEI